MRIILASTSPTRRALLDAVGLAHGAVAPTIDEVLLRNGLIAQGTPLDDVATDLAVAKALSVLAPDDGTLVIGADQVALIDDPVTKVSDPRSDTSRSTDRRRSLLTKPGSRAGVIATLEQLSGSRHELVSGVALAEDGRIVWRHTSRAYLTMRHLSADEIIRYADAVGDAVYGSVGAYHIEGAGLALMERIEGDHTAILGLPMLPLLTELRRRGVRLP